VRLKNDLERKLGIPIRLRAGAPGALKVLVDGELIYSKKQTGRLPSAEEIAALIRGGTPAK
jgi:selT/selW/selH-like putative selenoprotein